MWQLKTCHFVERLKLASSTVNAASQIVAFLHTPTGAAYLKDILICHFSNILNRDLGGPAGHYRTITPLKINGTNCVLKTNYLSENLNQWSIRDSFAYCERPGFNMLRFLGIDTTAFAIGLEHPALVEYFVGQGLLEENSLDEKYYDIKGAKLSIREILSSSVIMEDLSNGNQYSVVEADDHYPGDSTELPINDPVIQYFGQLDNLLSRNLMVSFIDYSKRTPRQKFQKYFDMALLCLDRDSEIQRISLVDLDRDFLSGAEIELISKDFLEILTDSSYYRFEQLNFF